MGDVSPTTPLSLQSKYLLFSKLQRQWLSGSSMCCSGNMAFFHQGIMLQILGCGMQFPNPKWFMCGPKTSKSGLEMSCLPWSRRNELCINPAIGMKSTRLTVWRTSKGWDLPRWLWSLLYRSLSSPSFWSFISSFKGFQGKHILPAPQKKRLQCKS